MKRKTKRLIKNVLIALGCLTMLGLVVGILRDKKIDEKIANLRTKSREVSYKKTVYCETINHKLKDVTSLIRNEQERISSDMVSEE